MIGGPGIEAALAGRVGGFDLAVDFAAPLNGVTAIFGPSGCGKTTVLRCIAGLERFAEGRVAVRGEVWQDGAQHLPPHRRPIGYVFQEANLFPHLRVRGNLEYGHRRARRAGAREAIRFDEVVELLGLGRLLERSVGKLSGGERQRVAIGRALLSQPRLLLMDEPLAALDRFSKDEILPYLERLRDTLSVPVLYVSHDIAEVERLADHLVLMREGRVVASGPLERLQADPTLPIARLPDAGVTLRAQVTGHDSAYCLSRVRVDGGDFLVPGHLGTSGTRHRIRIAASDVSLTREPPAASTILNVLPSRIVAAEAQEPSIVIVVVALGADGEGARVLARISRRSWDTLGLAAGQPIYTQIKGMALVTPEPREGDSESEPETVPDG